MHTRELVESISNLKKANNAIPRSSWQKLGERIFYVPLQTVRNSDESGGGKRVRFLSSEREGKKFVPVFSTEDLLFEWSSGNHQFLPVAGADLALVLPKGLALEFDSGSEFSLFLERSEFEEVLSEDASPEIPVDSSPEVAFAPEVAEVPDVSEKPATALNLPSDSEVEAKIANVLRSHSAILEGYYLGASGMAVGNEAFGGLLGLLIGEPKSGKPWDTEQRFSIVEAIAELSRSLYGYAGAIEVYDDLSNEVSRSWDLFKGQHLFYQRDELDDGAKWNAPESAGKSPRVGLFPGSRLRQNEKQ